MSRRILTNWRRALLTSLVAVLIVGSGVFLAGSQIDENFVTIKSESDIEFTIDKNNDSDLFAFFELFAPPSDVYPYPMFYITEDGEVTARGPITVDITQKSGSNGRKAIVLNGSADNIDVGIHINKERFYIWNTKDTTRADLIIRNLQATGSKSAIVETSSGEHRAIYAIESPEVWVEDYGSGQLLNGEARVELDPLFLETVRIDEAHPLKVFIQLTAEANPVYVTKGNDYFIVRELNGGLSNATFDYRVVAKRRGYEDARLEPYVP